MLGGPWGFPQSIFGGISNVGGNGFPPKIVHPDTITLSFYKTLHTQLKP